MMLQLLSRFIGLLLSSQETLPYLRPPWSQSKSWTWMTTVRCWLETIPGSTCVRLVGRTKLWCWPRGTATGHNMEDDSTSLCVVMTQFDATGSLHPLMVRQHAEPNRPVKYNINVMIHSDKKKSEVNHKAITITTKTIHIHIINNSSLNFYMNIFEYLSFSISFKPIKLKYFVFILGVNMVSTSARLLCDLCSYMPKSTHALQTTSLV